MIPFPRWPSAQGRWPGMLASFAAHGIAFLLLPSLVVPAHISLWKDTVDLRKPLRIRLPGPVYADAVPPPARPAASKRPGSASLPAVIQLDLGLAFDLPDVPRTRSARSVIQPDSRPLPANVLVPAIASWAKEFTPPASRVVTPGRRPLPESPVLDPTAFALRLPGMAGDPLRLLSASEVKAIPYETVALPEGSGAGVESAPSTALAALLARVLSTTRLDHPANGSFDVVVESTAGGLFPESTFTLSGRPVHAVFLKTGGAKDWILQYCVPASDMARESAGGAVVMLGAPPAVKPPYPRLTFRPPAGRESYLTVHGFIDTRGRFESLRMSGSTDPDELWLVLSVLEKWEFRPAAVAGSAARVEILLAIPPE